jgi:hypothetical protein
VAFAARMSQPGDTAARPEAHGPSRGAELFTGASRSNKIRSILEPAALKVVWNETLQVILLNFNLYLSDVSNATFSRARSTRVKITG